MAKVRVTNKSDRLLKIGNTQVASSRSVELDTETFEAWKAENGHNALLALTSLTIAEVEEQASPESEIAPEPPPPVEWDTVLKDESDGDIEENDGD